MYGLHGGTAKILALDGYRLNEQENVFIFVVNPMICHIDAFLLEGNKLLYFPGNKGIYFPACKKVQYYFPVSLVNFHEK